MFAEKRFRLKASDCKPTTIESTITEWLNTSPEKKILRRLNEQVRTWHRGRQPTPKQLAEPTPLFLAQSFVNVCPDLNPPAMGIQTAVMEIAHKFQILIFTTPNVLIEAKRIAKTIRMILSQYREIARRT